MAGVALIRVLLLGLSLLGSLLGSFVGPATAAQRWTGFPVILWQDPPTAALPGLPALGVTALKRFAAEPGGPPTPYYVENIATDFFSAYHRWTPSRPVTALFDDAKALHRADRSDPAAFIRQPSLSDPGALARMATHVAAVAAAHRPDHPLFYDLGDEPGIADLAAAWDFDLSPASLDGLRAYLRDRYGTLDALNRQWGTAWRSWKDVQPELTTAALARTDGNWSAWADWKDWMDESFARAVRAGVEAVRAGDRGGFAGLEGGQVPGWGGYDYGRLSPVLDVWEIYDAAANIDVALSLNPDLVVLTTSSAAGEDRRLWRDRMRGTGGLVIWDEDGDVVRPDGTPGPRGMRDGPVWRDLAGPVAARFAAGTVRPDGVAVLYSQASFRTQWLLDHAGEGERWTERDAEDEGGDTAWRTSLLRVQSALAHLALTGHWTTPDRLEATLNAPGVDVLLLPHVIALGDAELAAIRAFEGRGGRVLADVPPGAFDSHSRRRSVAPAGVADVVGPWPGDPAGLDRLAALLPPAPVTLRHGQVRAADVEAYVRWEGSTALVGLIPDQGLDEVVDVAGPYAVTALRRSPAILKVDPP